MMRSLTIRVLIAINWTICGLSFCMFTYEYPSIFSHTVYEHVRSELYTDGRPNDLTPEEIQIELDAHRKESQFFRPVFISGCVGWFLLSVLTGLNASMLMFLFKKPRIFDDELKQIAK